MNFLYKWHKKMCSSLNKMQHSYKETPYMLVLMVQFMSYESLIKTHFAKHTFVFLSYKKQWKCKQNYYPVQKWKSWPLSDFPAYSS